MKKILKFLSVLVIVALAFGLALFFAIKNFKSYESSVTVNKESRLISSDEDSISILQLTDIQTRNLIECGIAYPTVKYLVDKSQPDMIVLTGDNIADGSTMAVLSAMIELFDSFKIPWALVFGNHDLESALTMEEICATLEESEYCIFKTGKLDNRYGNYYYNIELQGETVRSLIFMDSERKGFTDEQVQWYKDTVGAITESEGRALPSLVFFHIPIKETVDANKLYADNPGIGSGEAREEPSTQNDNGFFEAIKELGLTDGMFYGHDHINNSIVEYEDVLFCYGTKSAVTVYFDLDMIGGNLITVTVDGFTVERVK